MGINKSLAKIIIILILIILIGGGAYFILVRKNNQSADDPNLLNKSIINPFLEEEYEENIKEILEAFSNQEIEITEAVKKIVDLTVPAKYKDLHLNLVIALSKISQGKDKADQSEIEEGLVDLAQIRQQYNWLPEILKAQ